MDSQHFEIFKDITYLLTSLNRFRYIPDPQLKSQVSPTKIKLGFYDALSAKFVEVPVSRYGTRWEWPVLFDDYKIQKLLDLKTKTLLSRLNLLFG